MTICLTEPTAANRPPRLYTTMMAMFAQNTTPCGCLACSSKSHMFAEQMQENNVMLHCECHISHQQTRHARICTPYCTPHTTQAMLCYAPPCPATPCHAMLCYAMLCYAMLCYAMLCYAMLCYAMLRYAMLCYAMLCFAMLCYAMLCYAMLCYSVYATLHLSIYSHLHSQSEH